LCAGSGRAEAAVLDEAEADQETLGFLGERVGVVLAEAWFAELPFVRDFAGRQSDRLSFERDEATGTVQRFNDNADTFDADPACPGDFRQGGLAALPEWMNAMGILAARH
jgi:hypothetical protein